MNYFIGFYRSTGERENEQGKKFTYDNVCFVCVKEMTFPDSKGFTFLKDPVRVPFKDFYKVVGLTFDQFMELYGSIDRPIPYNAFFSYNEWGTLKIQKFEVLA